MTQDRTQLVATTFVVMTGTLWGLYWIPVRHLAEIGLAGAWGTLAIVAAAAVLLLPFALKGRRRLARANPWALASLALGGFAFVLYSAGLVYGRVGIVTLLFYLTPVWSTLIAHFILGWRTPLLRIVAILAGVVGLVLILGADGEMPVPRGLGDWLGLASGVLWSIATTGIRTRGDTAAGESAFVFALGACLGAALLAPALEPVPTAASLGSLLEAMVWTIATGGIWWGLSLAALMWATARLEPARVGLLLMAEVLVGVASAAVLAGEHLGLLEMAGGAMVLCAAVLEIWPTRTNVPRVAE